MCGYRPTRAQWARTNNTNTNLTHEKSAPWKTVDEDEPFGVFGARLAKGQPSYTQDESPVGNS
jgi:hypothetical protein